MDAQDGLIPCPLNPAHRVKPTKMVYHQIRCKQQYGADQIERCRYNPSHIWPKGKNTVEDHLKQCATYAVMQSQSYVELPSMPPSMPPSYQKQNKDGATSAGYWGEDDVEEFWGADPAPAEPREIQLGQSSVAYKPPAERRQIRKNQLMAFKAGQADPSKQEAR